MDYWIEPLIPSLWFERIEMIARGQMGGMENALRHAAHLLQLTPAPFREVVRLGSDEASFEELLEAGSFDAAARHLIGQPTALSVEVDSDEVTYRATISCSILGRSVGGCGGTQASAILNAWTACLLSLKSEYGADLSSSPDQREHSARVA